MAGSGVRLSFGSLLYHSFAGDLEEDINLFKPHFLHVKQGYNSLPHGCYDY